MPDGPCIICGATNYPLSMGGPGICPACDSGSQHPAILTLQLHRQRQRIEGLDAEVAALRQAKEAAERELAVAIADLRGSDTLDDDLVGLSLVWIGGDELLDAFSAWYKEEDWPFGRHRAASAFLRERLATAERERETRQ